jgi:hypothetical protein
VDSVDWKQRIVELALVKQRLAEVDPRGLWPHHLPAVAATDARLGAVEAHFGEALDPGYRAFLQHADGWPAFYQTIDLFGSDDLLGGPRFAHAATMLKYVEDDVFIASKIRRDGVVPIAASPVDLDLFVMTRTSYDRPGVVLWLAGVEVDRFSSFEEFFLAITDYNRLEVERLQRSG